MSAAEGIVPFDVRFVDESTGHVLRRLWDFGDGEISLDREPMHTYRTQGTYTVTLQVTGSAGVVSQVVKAKAVNVLPKRDHLYIQDVYVYAGQKNVVLPVKVTNELSIQGFQVAGRFDTRVMTLAPGESFIDFRSTVAGSQRPEFVAGKQNPEEGWFTLGVVFDLLPPYTGDIMPGRKTNLVNLVADFSGNVANRTDAKLRFADDVGDPVIKNILTVRGGMSVNPELHNGQVLVIRPDIELLGPLFLRGDTDGGGTINIADAVFVLQHLFARGRPPACMDSADVDDNGRVNIADAISILSYLFSGSSSPAYPFPEKGLDGTPDSLAPCR
jgi:PKD repeat protein